MIKQSLTRIAQAGIFFMGLFGGFFPRIAPPEDIAKFWTGLATVVAGTIYLLVVLGARSRGSPPKARYWYLRSFVSLLGVFLLLGYFWVYSSRTVAYGGERKIAGTLLTPHAQKHLQGNPDLSSEELLLHYAGKTEDVWTADSLQESRLLLGGMYTLGIGALAFGLFCGAEGLGRR